MLWRVVSAMLLLAVGGWAQAPGEGQSLVPLRSPFANPLRAIVKPMAPASNATAQKPDAATTKPAAGAATKPSPATVKAVQGGRDPFTSPVSVATAGGAAVCTSGGKRCLAIDRIRLKGVVRSESGYIAVVVNAANRAFFLRENDPLLNGYVLRVTGSTVTFKETGKDRTGHATTREVTLTMGAPAV